MLSKLVILAFITGLFAVPAPAQNQAPLDFGGLDLSNLDELLDLAELGRGGDSELAFENSEEETIDFVLNQIETIETDEIEKIEKLEEVEEIEEIVDGAEDENTEESGSEEMQNSSEEDNSQYEEENKYKAKGPKYVQMRKD